MTQDFLLHDPPKAVEILRLRRDAAEEIERVSKRIIAARVSSIIATSGTAVALLRLALAMNHGQAGRMRGLAASVNREKILLRVPAMTNADRALWMLQSERAYFREVFGRDLVLDFI